jgi:hypothetical protein
MLSIGIREGMTGVSGEVTAGLGGRLAGEGGVREKEMKV